LKYLAAAVILAALSFPTHAVRAEPEIIIIFDYYDIEGQTVDELRDQMNIHGVGWTDGNTYDAFTDWHVKWNYTYRLTAGGCTIRSVDTTLNVEFRLPRWKNYADGPAALRKKWNVYMRLLRQHENGHKDIAIKAATEIEKSIAELEPAATCEELADTANELGRRIFSKHADKEKEYDAQTNFGETQGAVFP
jgi:predicted secreted Zn-dependent protease